MSKQINIEEAASWSQEEYEANVTYLSDRLRWEDVNTIKALRGGAEPRPEEAPQPEEAPVSGLPPSEGDELRGMTAQQVLEWVGDDQERANMALAIENQKDEPRTKLTKRLGELANP